VVRFTLNGEPQEFASPPDGLTVQSVLERFELAGRRVAVAINAHVVPRSRFAEARIADGDRVEVIQAVGGG
jgi:sulfur carrier protein